MKYPGSHQVLEKYRSSTEENPDSRSDECLVSKIIEGKINLFEVITKRYNQQLFRIIRGYLSDENDVKDVLQSAYLKAYEGLSSFRGEAQFSTWLIRITINEALKKVRQKKNAVDYNSVTIRQNTDLTGKADKATPETNVIKSDMNKHLEEAIDALPPKYRSVLIMRELEQMSTRETAESLNITRTNVKVRLHRAKKLLRNELEQMLEKVDLYTFRGENCERMTREVMKEVKARG